MNLTMHPILPPRHIPNPIASIGKLASKPENSRNHQPDSWRV
ncbi:hypothetical protein [Baaleninema sp.]